MTGCRIRDPEAARTGSDRPPRGECRSPAPGAAYPPGKEGHMFHHHARLALGTALLLAASVASAEDLKLADFQPEVHLWLVHAQSLANLSQPLTFFAGKVVQQLNVSG